MNILKKILQEKEKSIYQAKQKNSLDELIFRLKYAPRIISFKKRLKKRNGLALIAEIKKSSPSLGVIRKGFNPLKIAKTYERLGVDCLSVLTEEKFFDGNIKYIKKIKENVELPILRKDFIIDEYQIYESRLFGADAILLIASILSLVKLKKFLDIAKSLKLDCLVECENLTSLKKALSVQAEIIGINNRNLHNFKTDINRTRRLIKFIPEDRIIVSESGIKTKQDIEFLKDLGVDAVLIGEAFMRSKDITKKFKELFS
jgi:indole-3-glycerol phosphate synthase